MTSEEAAIRACALFELVSSPFPACIYRTHPNCLTIRTALQQDAGKVSRQEPPEWNAWWQWSGDCEDGWKVLVFTNDQCGISGSNHNKPKDFVPQDLSRYRPPDSIIQLLGTARALSLPRQPYNLPSPGERPLGFLYKGMSPKKFHEVSRMTAYVLDLLDSLLIRNHTDVRHVVDIGAGQVRPL